MASQVGNVLAAVQAAVTATLAPGAVAFEFGERFAQERKAGFRVCWAPGVDRFAPASGNNPRTRGGPVATRRAQVRAYLFADTYDAACALLNATVLALHGAAGPCVEFESAEWFGPGFLDYGDGCLLTFALQVPVTRPDPTHTAPTQTAFDTTGTVAGDGFLDAGES